MSELALSLFNITAKKNISFHSGKSDVRMLQIEPIISKECTVSFKMTGKNQLHSLNGSAGKWSMSPNSPLFLIYYLSLKLIIYL